MSKGENQLQSGDRLNFIFDYYDEQGNLVEHKASDSMLYVTNPDYLVVKDKQVKKTDVVFHGILIDVYQRELQTEEIVYHID